MEPNRSFSRDCNSLVPTAQTHPYNIPIGNPEDSTITLHSCSHLHLILYNNLYVCSEILEYSSF